MRTDNWLKLMSGFVLVGVFAAGALFGAGLVHWREPSSPPMMRRPPGGPIDAMIHELALDPDQVAALQAIEQAHRGELEAIVRATQPRVRGVLFAIEDELRPKLRPEQIKQLEAWRARRATLPPPGGGLLGMP
jgi:hypothetical protein